MGDQATNALIAIVLGTIFAVLLLIPTAAVQYRLDGRLGPRDLTILVTSAIYSLAIWTYTLLPMPADHTFRCKGSQTRLLASLGLIHLPDRGGPLALLREPAFQQIVLNVLLFVPLGAAVAVLLPRRGWPVAIVIPLVLSAAVEFAQGSIPGRVTDPGDVLWNTVGGAIGVISVTLLRLFGSGLRRTLQRRSVTRA